MNSHAPQELGYPEPPEGIYAGESLLAGVPGALLRGAWRNRHITIPLTVPWCLLAAAEALGHHPEPLWAEGAVAALASAATWNPLTRKWGTDPRVRDWQWTSEAAYARATIAAGGGWLVLAARFGPLTPTLELLLALGCTAWGIPFWWHKRPRDKRARRRHAAEVARWDAWWRSHAHAWGAGGSSVADLETRGAVESLLIQLVPGRQSIATVKGVIPLVESALGGYVAHGMTRLELRKDNPSQVWLHLKRDEPLREAIEWNPRMAPTDIRKPAPLGVRESGEWLKRSLRASFFILGRTRSGKSNELSVILATITGCRNARTLLIDMKGGRAARPWLPAVDWLATTLDEARLMLGCVDAEIEGRAAYAYNGSEQLEPTEDVPTLFVVIDETHKVTSEMSGDARCAAALANIASQGQGVEVYVIVLTQYGGLAESVRTEQTRSNLNVRLCFQTEKREHGTFALGDDAQNQVDTTKLAVKGAFYFREDSETAPEQVRGPHIPHEMVREIAARNAAVTELPARPLRLYAPAWQRVYDSRWERLPAGFRADAPQVTHSSGGPSPAEEAPMPANKINIGVPPDITEEVAAINAEATEIPVSDADIARAAAQRAARGAPPVDLRTEFDRRRHSFAVALQAAPAGGISPAELKKAGAPGRTWIHQELDALVAAGAVIKVRDGRYRPAGDANIWAAMEMIDQVGERLAGEARELAGTGS